MKVLSTHCTLNLSDKQLATGDFTEALKWWDECIAAHKAAGVEVYRRAVDAAYRDARRVGDLLPLFQRGRRPLQGRRHQVRLPQPLAGVREGRGSRDAGLHARKYRSRQGLLPDGRLLDGDGAGQSGRLLHEVSGPFPAASYQDRREVGQSGMVGYDAIFRNAATAGVENIIVEMEGSSYGDVLRSVRECVDYLNEAPSSRLPMRNSPALRSDRDDSVVAG